MNRAGSIQDSRMDMGVRHTSDMMTDLEAWLGNGLALVLTLLALASGAIGVFTSFSYFWHSDDPFSAGMVWLAGGIILAISANAFRREHHIVNDKDRDR